MTYWTGLKYGASSNPRWQFSDGANTTFALSHMNNEHEPSEGSQCVYIVQRMSNIAV